MAEKAYTASNKVNKSPDDSVLRTLSAMMQMVNTARRTQIIRRSHLRRSMMAISATDYLLN
jgi:hypothetical protein